MKVRINVPPKNIIKNLKKANMISISPLEMTVKNKNNKYMASDCPLAGKHLKQLETDTNISNDEALHPIELMAKSYRL